MNIDYIMKLIEPHLNDRELTYAMFDKIFYMMSRREQYEIADILATKGIELVDEFNSAEPFVPKADAQPDEVFNDDTKKQSNEILCALIQEGNAQAQQSLCQNNAGLVAKEVQSFYKRWNHDLEEDDLMQAGMIGLLKAAEKFEISLGYKFSTYATWWIRQTIMREIYDKGFTVRVPVHVFDTINKLLNTSRRLLLEFNREPTLEELAERMMISVEETEFLKHLARLRSKISLDMPINDDGDTTFGDVVADEHYDLEQEVMKICLLEELNAQLKTLKPREAEIIRLRYGINDGYARTLEEIGHIFGLTRERIRQIEVKALRKLRHPSRSIKFRDFY